MSNNVDSQPTIDTPTAYAPASASAPAITAAAPVRSNPVGIAALVSAGLLTLVNSAFQLLTMNAVLAGGPFSANLLVTLAQPAIVGVLAVVTVALGAIATLQRGRVRLAAGIALGVGMYALVSLLTGVVVAVGYSLA